MRKITLAACLYFVALATPAWAGILVEYDFSNIPTNVETESVDPGFIALGVDAGPITAGPGLELESGAMSINRSGWTTDPTPDPDDYYQFIVGPLGAAPLNFDELAFTARRSATGPLGLEVRASLDDFATSEVIALQALSDETSNFRVTIGLAGFSFLQGVTDDVTFRIFASGAEGSAGTFRLGIDETEANDDLPPTLLVSGTVVPEPSSLALCGLAVPLVLTACFLRCRRKPVTTV